MHDFGELLVGAVFGMFITVCLVVVQRDRGRDECEKVLPRTEKCVQQWVPEPKPTTTREGGR